MNKFAWLFCGCILALSACSEKQLGPDSGTADGPEIRFGVSEQGSGTKALIEADGLAVAGTQLHVFDILTGFNGTVNGQSPVNGELTYIDKTIGYVGSAWPFVTPATNAAETPAYYRWTKTGTHKFFGYLTKDPAGNTFTGATMSGKVLSISERALTPATTPQFDFLYSDIITRDAATGPYTAIPLSMSHLFTALSVELINETIVPIEDVQVSFIDVHPTQSATIDWGDPVTETVNNVTKYYPRVTYTPGDAAELVLGTADLPGFVEGQTPAVTPLFTDANDAEEYRLLWPQSDLDAASVKVTYLASSGTDTVTKSLEDVFKDANETVTNEMVPGCKYLLKITITAEDLEFELLVDPLDEHYYGRDADHSDYLIKP